MIKNYLYIFSFITILITMPSGFAQQIEQDNPNGKIPSISKTDINIYPNPVTHGKVYISSKYDGSREIQVFDVLGKKVLASSIFGKVIDVSTLSPGVYILKIKESSVEVTRKLVIR